MKKQNKNSAKNWKKFGAVALTLAFLPMGAVTANAATTPASSTVCAGMTTDIYQSVNPTSNASLLTANANEIAKAKVNNGFTVDKGVSFKAAGKEKEGLVPVYRMFKKGDFVYIPKWSGSNEYESAKTKYDYVDQGINFYASPKKIDCGIPVDRFILGSKHRYATTDADKAELKAAGWTAEGTIFWAMPATTVPVTPPVTTPPVVTPPVEPTPEPLSPQDADGKFSIAVIPDTQQEVGKDSRFINRTQWLVNNKENLDLRFVEHTGDVVNWDTPTHDQYEVASKAMKVLDDNKIPNALTIGNHDTAAVGVGGGAADSKNTRTLVRNTTTFNTYFNVNRYPGITTFEAGKVDNAYQTFDAAGQKWLMLNLELWPRTEVVNWAKTVVASHPDYNVVVSTHSYLNGDSTIDQSASYGSNSAQYVYDNLIKQYANIKIVVSGHVGEAGYREDTGVNGNKIVSYLGTFHSNTTNPVRTLEIDTKNGTLKSSFYGPSNGTTWPQYDKTTTGVSFVK